MVDSWYHFDRRAIILLPSVMKMEGRGSGGRKNLQMWPWMASKSCSGLEVQLGFVRALRPIKPTRQCPSLIASQPGAALPWRVIHIPASGLAESLKKTLPGTSESQRSEARRRVRAGKKRRIASRKKHAVEARAAETDKMKKARKNREKKLKKREKNRNLKAQVPQLESGKSATPKSPV
jgi:hypothetical protein